MTNNAIIRLRRNGELTIPKEVREKLGLEKDDFILISIEKEEVTLKKLQLQDL